MAGSCVVRDAVGPVFIPGLNGTDAGNQTMLAVALLDTARQAPSAEVQFVSAANDTAVPTQFCIPGNCSYGLQNDMQVNVSKFIFVFDRCL